MAADIKIKFNTKRFFQVSKDGNLKIWNIQTNLLVRTIKATDPANNHECSYAEMPSIDLIDSKLFYSIKNVFFLYDI